jgi:O-antigen/teichoic acid export membrane protein
VAGLALPLASVRVVPENLLRKELSFDRIARTQVLAALVAIPTTLLLALAGAGVWALVASSLAMALTQALDLFAGARWRPSLEVGSTRARDLFRFCRHTLGGRVCWAVYQQTDVLFLGKYAPVPSVGVYSMAMQLVAFPIDKVFSLVNEISYPAMARVQQDVDTLQRSALRSFKLVALLAFPIYGGLALVADDLVRVVLTEKWLGAVPIVRVLAAYGALSSLAVLLAPLMLARYRPDVVFRYSFAQMLIMPAAFWVGSAWGGPTGVALAWTLAYPAALSWLTRQVLSELQLRPGQLARALLPAGAAATVMGCVVLAVRTGVEAWFPEHGASRLALSVATGVVCYSVATWLLDGGFVAELARLARAATRSSGAATREQRA